MKNNSSVSTKGIPVSEQLKTLARIISFTKPYLATFFVAIVFAGLLAITNAVLPRIIQILIDDYFANDTATMTIILTFAGFYALGTIVKAIIWYFNLYFFYMASEKTVANIRNTIYEKLHTLGMNYFDQTPAGTTVSRVTNDTETIKQFWNVFLTVLEGVLGLGTSFVAMYLLDAEVTLWIMLFLPILIFVVGLYQRYSSVIYRNMREKLGILNAKLAETINGISIIQQFRQEERFQADFEETNTDYFKARYRMTKMNTLLLSPVINLLSTMALVFILGFFGVEALDGPVEVGVIYAFTSYIRNFFQPMTRMMDSLSIFQDGIVSSSRVLSVLDNEEYAPVQNEASTAAITQAKIEFKNVTFSYDNENNVLKNISFVAYPGETVALVGHTGSGKSSIINLIMRFYEFYEGDILIDDVSIKNYPLSELRSNIGLVLQDSFLFYGTIKDNIRLKNKAITDAEIREAAQFVQVDEFIDSMPDKYNSRVIERGASYSSGQRQLISFASTIVTDPKILILDEATANIDTETEVLIQEGLSRMRKGRTTLAIAHRLSTIRDANLILVLDHGEIVERGTHEELLSQMGIYYGMYELQKSGLTE